MSPAIASRITRVAVVGFKPTAACLAIVLFVGPGVASVPTLGGLMNHVNVGIAPLDNPQPGQPSFGFVIGLDDFKPEGESLVVTQDTYATPYDMLNGKAYNAQYGWLRSGRWGVLPGQTVWIELTEASEGLAFYEGGLGVDAGGTGVIDGSEHTLEPIFGTDGSPPQWAWGTATTGLTMTHHWAATQTPGPHFASFTVSVRDDATGLDAGLYAPGKITLRWQNPLPTLTGDFNGSGAVEQGDLDLVLTNWGQSFGDNLPTAWAGVPPSGAVDQAELDAVLTNWGATSAPLLAGLDAVPEPACAVMLATTVWGSRRHRNRNTS